MTIDVILLLYIHFLALSNSNGAYISSLKSRGSRLKILINEWSEIINSNGTLKAQKTGIEICKASLIRNFQNEV